MQGCRTPVHLAGIIADLKRINGNTALRINIVVRHAIECHSVILDAPAVADDGQFCDFRVSLGKIFHFAHIVYNSSIARAHGESIFVPFNRYIIVGIKHIFVPFIVIVIVGDCNSGFFEGFGIRGRGAPSVVGNICASVQSAFNGNDFVGGANGETCSHCRHCARHDYRECQDQCEAFLHYQGSPH